MEPIKDLSEITKHDQITVLRWINIQDRSWVGNVLEVKAVDAPFIVVNVGLSNVVLDFREVEIGKLSDDFVKAVRPFIKREIVNNG